MTRFAGAPWRYPVGARLTGAGTRRRRADALDGAAQRVRDGGGRGNAQVAEAQLSFQGAAVAAPEYAPWPAGD